jgi:hypothetical protein
MLSTASTLFGCSSPSSVPSWAVAAAQNQYREKRVAQHPHQNKTLIAHPTTGGPAVDDPKVGGAKVDDPKVDDDVTGSAAPNFKYKDYKLFSKQEDQRQEEENRRIKAAITICRDC